MDARDLEAIRGTVIGVVHHIDGRRWGPLRTLFADFVAVDYTSLFGGQVQMPRADDLVEGWRVRLTPVTATQHLLGPIAVYGSDASATAGCHVRGYHFAKGLPEGTEWMIAGHYLFELGKEGSAWKIRKMTLETFYQTGNLRLLDQAAQR